MNIDAQKADGAILRIRLDRTLKTGAPVRKRVCNLHCIWCHHDYMDHELGQRNAISNQIFVQSILRKVYFAMCTNYRYE